MSMSPLRWVGVGLGLAGAALVALLWFGYLSSQKALSAAQGALQADTAAFHAIASVDRNTARVLASRQEVRVEQEKHNKVQDEKLAKAVAANPDWASQHVPAAVLDSLRSD
jgi:hypothetical protein